MDIYDGLAAIKECLDPGAPEPGSSIIESGLEEINNCFNGGQSVSVTEAGLDEISSILGGE